MIFGSLQSIATGITFSDRPSGDVGGLILLMIRVHLNLPKASLWTGSFPQRSDDRESSIVAAKVSHTPDNYGRMLPGSLMQYIGSGKIA